MHRTLNLFGLLGELVTHTSRSHPPHQLTLPRPGWQLVVQRADAYRDLNDNNEPLAAWFGPRQRAEILRPGAEVDLVCISLPAALNGTVARLLGCSTTSNLVELTEWLPLRKLLDAATVDPVRVQQELIELLAPWHHPPPLNTNHSISNRTQRYRYQKQLGLSLRELRQIRRSATTALAIMTTNDSLASIAQTQGYADQAHMSRRIKQRFPYSPKILRAIATGHPGLYLDLAETYKNHPA